MKKTVLCVLILFFFTISCAPKLVPPQDQHRMAKVEAPVNVVYRAVKLSLVKHGYAIVDRDITVGLTKARKINGKKLVVVSVRNHHEGGAFVKIRLIAGKKGRPANVPEKTMSELENILQDIETISSGL